MILTGTTESIQIVLSGSVTTQSPFYTSYNQMTSSSIVPDEQNGTTNGTTAVNILDGPSSDFIHQLKAFYLDNLNTRSITCIIRYNNNNTTLRTIYRAVLNVGESLKFSLDEGWFVSDRFGARKYASTNIYPTGNIIYPEFTVNNTISSVNLTSNNVAIISLGKASAPFTSITMGYSVSQSAATITHAEMGIYRVAQPMGIGTQQLTKRCGFVNTASIWNTIGIKYTNIPTSDIQKGDDLYVVFSIVATTTVGFRGSNIGDDLSSILRCLNNAAGTWRPSFTENMTATSLSSALAGISLVWQGFAPSV